jgi:hypothetical protein
MWTHARSAVRRLLRWPRGPTITRDRGRLDPYGAPLTFVVVCGRIFDQRVPNAATTARLGIARGFELIGIPYILVDIHTLARRLLSLPNPICWISAYDYAYLDAHNLRALKRHRHIVWVAPWFDGDQEFWGRHGFPNMTLPENISRAVLSSEPAFVFTISPSRSFEYYHGWVDCGARLVSLPLACDTTLYRDDVAPEPAFEAVEIAFVGGYWPYKAQQFDRYLKPYESRLTVFGYAPWPYSGYAGRLSEAREPALYRQALLSPTINEPHVERMGIDVNERVFKVLGSGGMTITDVTPVYQEWFTDDELLVPSSLDEYHAMVEQTLRDDALRQRYRDRGRRAVWSRHTYAHRARAILAYLGVQWPENPRRASPTPCAD